MNQPQHPSEEFDMSDHPAESPWLWVVPLDVPPTAVAVFGGEELSPDTPPDVLRFPTDAEVADSTTTQPRLYRFGQVA
jgi:hypothetical protein